MTDNLQCPKCSQKFNSADLKHLRCPSCNKWLDFIAPPSAEAVPSASKRMPVKDESEATLEGSSMEVSLADLVEAQDRTTHAVRSLALYLFITIATSFLGVALILIDVPVAVFIGAAIILAGFVWSIVAGIDELSKSKP